MATFIGASVLHKFPGYGEFTGTVTGTSGEKLTVEWEDGCDSHAPGASCRLQQWLPQPPRARHAAAIAGAASWRLSRTLFVGL